MNVMNVKLSSPCQAMSDDQSRGGVSSSRFIFRNENHASELSRKRVVLTRDIGLKSFLMILQKWMVLFVYDLFFFSFLDHFDSYYVGQLDL